MLKIADYICLGSAKHSEDFTGIRVLNHIYLGHNRGTSIDVLLSGVSPLTLVNAVKLSYVKAFGKCEQDSETYIDSVTLDGKCEQDGTPTPTSPVDIVANNGAIKAFCGNKWTDVNKLSGYIIQLASGTIQENSNYNVSAPIILKAGDYSVSYYSSGTGSRPFTIWECDAQGDLAGESSVFNITRPAMGTNTGTFTIDRDMYVRISWRNDFTDIVVAPTTAIIYYDGTVETATDNVGNVATAQPLLSVADYKDTQEVLTGAVTRNVGIKVFDGTEDWYKITDQNAYYTSISDMLYCKPVQPGLSNQFIGAGVATANMPDNSIKLTYTSDNIGAILIKHNDTTTLEDWEQFVTDQYNSGNPIIAIYPLATATTETVSGQVLNKEPVTVTGSLTGLVANVVSSTHTVPKPTQSLDIVANNGVLKLSPNLIDESTLVKVSATIWRYYSTVSQGGFDLKANTTYTLSTDDSNINVYFYDYDTKTSVASGKHYKTYTPTEDTKVYFTLYLSSGIPENTHIQLEIGSTATTYRPYGSVYYDGTVETVTTKQAFVNDSDVVDRTGLSSATGSTVVNNSCCYVLFPCKAGVTYTAQTDTADLIGGNFIEYRQPSATSANFIKSITATDDGLVDGVYQFHAVCDADGWAGWQCKANKATAMANNWQITADTSSATCQPLLSVGTYKDVQNITNGAVTRNVGVKVFDGTEDWTVSSRYAGSCYTTISGSLNATTGIAVLCSHFENSVGIDTYSRGKCLKQIAFNIWYGDNASTAVADLKQYLASQYAAGTPVIIVYPLATPTTETLTGQTLTITQGTNIVTATGAVSDLELEISYKAYAEITVEEIEAVNTDENVEVTIS